MNLELSALLIATGKIVLHVFFFSRGTPGKERIQEYERENKWTFQTYSDLSPCSRLTKPPVASD